MTEPKYAEMGLEDEMPYGKHKGVKMKDVPVSYLNYMWNSYWHESVGEGGVAAFCLRYMEALKRKTPKSEWLAPLDRYPYDGVGEETLGEETLGGGEPF